MESVHEIITKIAKNLSEEVKDRPLPKKQEGLFSGQTADYIVKSLLKDTKNNATKALEKLDFYINRGGAKIPEKERVVLNRAKKMLEKKEK